MLRIQINPVSWYQVTTLLSSMLDHKSSREEINKTKDLHQTKVQFLLRIVPTSQNRVTLSLLHPSHTRIVKNLVSISQRRAMTLKKRSNLDKRTWNEL